MGARYCNSKKRACSEQIRGLPVVMGKIYCLQQKLGEDGSDTKGPPEREAFQEEGVTSVEAARLLIRKWRNGTRFFLGGMSGEGRDASRGS